MNQPEYSLVDALYHWAITGLPPVIRVCGISVTTRQPITTTTVYGCDPFNHYVWCCDGTVYLLHWTDRDADRWAVLTAYTYMLPVPYIPNWLPSRLNWNQHFVSSNKSSRLISGMPDEIMIRILSFLPRSSWAASMATCRQFYRCGIEAFLTPDTAASSLQHCIQNSVNLNSIPLMVRRLGQPRANIITRKYLCVCSLKVLSTLLDAEFMNTKTLKVLAKRVLPSDVLWRAVNQIINNETSPDILLDVCVTLAKRRQIDTHIGMISQHSKWSIVQRQQRLINACINAGQIQTLQVIRQKFPVRLPIDTIIHEKNFAVVEKLAEADMLTFDQKKFLLEWACRFPSRALSCIEALLKKDCGDLQKLRRAVEQRAEHAHPDYREYHKIALALITSRIAAEAPLKP